MTRFTLRRALVSGTACVAAAWLASAVRPAAHPGPSRLDQSQQDQTRPPIFRAGANFVLVDAYPWRDGQLIEGLTADAFVVLEDGVPQVIEEFEFVDAGGLLPVEARRNPTSLAASEREASDPRNRVFVLFLDGDHVPIEGARRAAAPGVAFLNDLSGPGDLFGLLTPEIPVPALTFTRELAGAQAALERYWEEAFARRATASIVEPRSEHELTVYQCFMTRYFEPASNEALVGRLISKIRREQVLLRLRELVARLTGLRDARSHVLLFSGGWSLQAADPDLTQHAWRELPQIGTDPFGRPTTERHQPGEPANTATCDAELMRLALMDERQVFQETLEEAQRSNVSIHPVDPAGLAAFDDPSLMTRQQPRRGLAAPPLRDRHGTLRALAGATDGVATVGTTDLTTLLRQLARGLSAYYLLGYYSTNREFDGRYREIEVRLREPDEKVSARRGYLAPTTETLREMDAARDAATAAEASRAPVEDALNALARLDTAEELFLDVVAVNGEIIVLAEATPAAIGRYLDAGAVAQMIVATRTGEALAEDRHPFPEGRPASLYRVAAPPAPGGEWRVTFRVQGDLGPLSRTLDVAPEPPAALMGRMIFRATPASRSPLWPAPSRLFRRAERVHIEWTVPEPLDSRTARLLGLNGDPLPVPVALSEMTADGRAVLALDLRLAPLAPGDYVIEVTASAGGATTTDRVAIRVRE